MGIQGLMKLICDYSPSSIKDHAIKDYFGEIEGGVAIRNVYYTDVQGILIV